ncbi:MAG TPA: GNAT family N-acetyltransferase [Candidatus Limnocylindria bacterium]|nr:GNAT family N-acetyltransferase [Candidatus Limnocylindria bacterium]
MTDQPVNGVSPQAGTGARRTKPAFVSLKNRLHLPGVGELLAPCTRHLTPSQYKRMISAWAAMERYHVFGMLVYGQVIGFIAIEEKNKGFGRVLAIGVLPQQQMRGLGRRLLVEAFCSLGLEELTADAPGEVAGFYERLHFEVGDPRETAPGIPVYPCVLRRSVLFGAYQHEYSSGAVLYCVRGGERLYVLVTELSGNTGLPKGHVEAGETQEMTALREIFEETGVEATIVPGFGGEIVYPQGRYVFKHFTYFLATFTPEQEPRSGTDVVTHLLPFDQALRKLSFADVRTILREAEQFLNTLSLEHS